MSEHTETQATPPVSLSPEIAATFERFAVLTEEASRMASDWPRGTQRPQFCVLGDTEGNVADIALKDKKGAEPRALLAQESPDLSAKISRWRVLSVPVFLEAIAAHAPSEDHLLNLMKKYGAWLESPASERTSLDSRARSADGLLVAAMRFSQQQGVDQPAFLRRAAQSLAASSENGPPRALKEAITATHILHGSLSKRSHSNAQGVTPQTAAETILALASEGVHPTLLVDIAIQRSEQPLSIELAEVLHKALLSEEISSDIFHSITKGNAQAIAEAYMGRVLKAYASDPSRNQAMATRLFRHLRNPDRTVAASKVLAHAARVVGSSFTPKGDLSDYCMAGTGFLYLLAATADGENPDVQFEEDRIHAEIINALEGIAVAKELSRQHITIRDFALHLGVPPEDAATLQERCIHGDPLKEFLAWNRTRQRAAVLGKGASRHGLWKPGYGALS